MNALKPGYITDKTNLLVTDAAYFHGSWASVFSPDATKPHRFESFEKVGEVQMMNLTDHFDFGEFLAFN